MVLLEDPLAGPAVESVEGRLDEGLDVVLPADRLLGHVDDAAPAHGGQRGVVEVLALEQDADREVEFDALAVAEAEQHGVVEHGVHVLDPHGVDGPVEDQPLVVLLPLAHLAFHDVGRQPLFPVASHRVLQAVQLLLRDALGVDRDVRHVAQLLDQGVVHLVFLDVELICVDVVLFGSLAPAQQVHDRVD